MQPRPVPIYVYASRRLSVNTWPVEVFMAWLELPGMLVIAHLPLADGKWTLVSRTRVSEDASKLVPVYLPYYHEPLLLVQNLSAGSMDLIRPHCVEAAGGRAKAARFLMRYRLGAGTEGMTLANVTVDSPLQWLPQTGGQVISNRPSYDRHPLPCELVGSKREYICKLAAGAASLSRRKRKVVDEVEDLGEVNGHKRRRSDADDGRRNRGEEHGNERSSKGQHKGGNGRSRSRSVGRGRGRSRRRDERDEYAKGDSRRGGDKYMNAKNSLDAYGGGGGTHSHRRRDPKGC